MGETESDADVPPTANLFVELRPGVSVQMCFMRPDITEVCPDLPFLLPTPAVAPLDADTIRAEDMLLIDHDYESNANDAPRKSTKAERDCTTAVEWEAVLAIECALAHEEPLPAECASLVASRSPTDWQDVFASSKDGIPFARLHAAQLKRLALNSSEALCDQLLFHSFPQLLDREQTAEAFPGDAPLPPLLSELLLLLLYRGSTLRLSAEDFSEQVTSRLHGVSGLGVNAARQATIVFTGSAPSHGL